MAEYAPAPQSPPSAALLARAGKHLEQFSSTLPPTERAALRALLTLADPEAPFTALGAIPAEQILDAAQIGHYRRLSAESAAGRGALRPAMVMIMKATRLCNLRCTYCNQWREGPNQVMSFPVLARAVRDVLRAPGVRHVQFVWHGGEATLLPTSFYRKALWLQQQFRQPGQVVRNAIQTNATHLNDEWLAFLRRYGVSVGVSLDGPPEVHDQRRLDVSGRPTSARVHAGLERLRSAGVEHGILLVVDDAIVDVGPERVLAYLLDIGVTHVDLLNALPMNTPVGAPWNGAYLPWPRYIDFLRGMFRSWWPEHAERLWIRELGGLVQQLGGGPPATCVFAGDCFGGFLTIDPSGDVSACDKYVDDAGYHFGNLLTQDLTSVLSSGGLHTVRSDNDTAVDRMRDCPWFSVCHGGCPHDRYTSLRRRPDSDQRCCGFAPLLSEMAHRLAEEGAFARAEPAPAADS